MSAELSLVQQAGADAPAVSLPVADRLEGVAVPESWLPGGSRDDGDPSASFVMEAERMRVYQLALELQCHANTLVPSVHRVVRDQFERASLSVVLNSAEAFGRFSRKQKRYHVGVARGSAMECAALCDVLRVRRLAPLVETTRAEAPGCALRPDAEQAGTGSFEAREGRVGRGGRLSLARLAGGSASGSPSATLLCQGSPSTRGSAPAVGAAS